MSNSLGAQIDAYVAAEEGRFLEELFGWLRIPSISADPAHAGDMTAAADYIAEQLKAAGAKTVEQWPTSGNPVVFAELIVDPVAPTVLVYGHYDVQPPDPVELWERPPFEPYVKGAGLSERIYARGACDDKGQVHLQVKAFETAVRTGALKCNVKYLIEGEEEIGSNNLELILDERKDRLAADLVLISDTSMLSLEVPTITTGLRGLSYLEVTLQGPNRDLHSGVYGGSVVNPVNALCGVLASLHDDNSQVVIPGFYDDVVSVSPEERSMMARAPFDKEAYMKDLGVEELGGEEGFLPRERTAIRPSFDINGIWGGYTGAGAKTVLPAVAHAKISFRLVPAQDPDRITELVAEHLIAHTPMGTKIKITPHHGGHPAVTPIELPGYQAAAAAMKDVFGTEPLPQREGGSIPIVHLFKAKLGLEAVLLGFGLDEDAIHSPNESFGVENYRRGVRTVTRFLHGYGEIGR